MIELKFTDYQCEVIDKIIAGNFEFDSQPGLETKDSEEIISYKEKLESLSEDELISLYEVEKANKIEKESFDAERFDRTRFFNDEIANADYEYWGKISTWSLDEAITLIFDKNPEYVTWEKIKELHDTSPFAYRYSKTRELVLRARENKELDDQVNPLKFVNWVRSIELTMPLELVKVVKKRHSFNKDDARTYLDEQSVVWSDLREKIITVINKYPDLVSQYPEGEKIKIEDVKEWLEKTHGLKTRESHIASKILTERFNI